MAEDIKSQISEAMKKIVLAGVGTIFLTEETVRAFMGELKLPKELWSGILENAGRTKTEFLGAFARELAQVLSKVDLPAEAQKFFEGHKLKLNLEISFDAKEAKDAKEKPRASSRRRD